MTSHRYSIMTSQRSNPQLVAKISTQSIEDHDELEAPKHVISLFPPAKMPETTIPREVKLDELKGKVYLRQRDTEILVEESRQLAAVNEKTIIGLRKQNRKKRQRLTEGLQIDKQIISKAFAGNKEALLCNKDSTVDRVVDVMEHKVGKARNLLNCLLYEIEQREKKLTDQEQELFRLITFEYKDLDKNQKREFRTLVNKLEKFQIKYDSALNIQKRYEKILEYFITECRSYPITLTKIEKELDDSVADLNEAVRMKQKAIRCWHQTNHSLLIREQQVLDSKKLRERRISKARRDVDRQKDLLDAASRRVHEIEDEKESRMTLSEADGPKGYYAMKQSMIAMEEALDKLKRSINVADLDDVVTNVANQDETTQRLVQAKNDMLRRVEHISDELDDEIRILENIKFTTDQNMLKSRQYVQTLLHFLKQEEERTADALNDIERKKRLKLQVETGIETIYAKLGNIKVKVPEYKKNETPLDCLHFCEMKVQQLKTMIRQRRVSQSNLRRLDSSLQLQDYLEHVLPLENIRIRLSHDIDLEPEESQFMFDHDLDNDGLLSREDIKARAVNCLMPSNKKGRKAAKREVR